MISHSSITLITDKPIDEEGMELGQLPNKKWYCKVQADILDGYILTKEELTLLYEFLKYEYIPYEKEALHAVINKIYAYIKTD